MQILLMKIRYKDGRLPKAVLIAQVVDDLGLFVVQAHIFVQLALAHADDDALALEIVVAIARVKLEFIDVARGRPAL